jgi:hypothetical protein
MFIVIIYCGARSLLSIETADKPGLLMEVVQIINDINVDVESAEIDTEVWSWHPNYSCYL